MNPAAVGCPLHDSGHPKTDPFEPETEIIRPVVQLSEFDAVRRIQVTWSERMLSTIGVLRRKDTEEVGMDALALEWLAVDIAKQRGERTIFIGTRDIFRRQRETVLENLEQIQEEQQNLSIPPGALLRKQDALVNRLFDLPMWNEEIKDELTPRAEAAIRDGFERALRRIDVDGSFDPSNPIVRRTIRDIELQSELVNETTADRIHDTVQDVLQEGESFDELGERLDQQFSEWSRWRAQLHARLARSGSFEAW